MAGWCRGGAGEIDKSRWHTPEWEIGWRFDVRDLDGWLMGREGCPCVGEG